MISLKPLFDALNIVLTRHHPLHWKHKQKRESKPYSYNKNSVYLAIFLSFRILCHGNLGMSRWWQVADISSKNPNKQLTEEKKWHREDDRELIIFSFVFMNMFFLTSLFVYFMLMFLFFFFILHILFILFFFFLLYYFYFSFFLKVFFTSFYYFETETIENQLAESWHSVWNKPFYPKTDIRMRRNRILDFAA